MILILFISFLSQYTMQQDSDLQEKIEQLNRQMETSFNDGDLLKVASFYKDDGYLISPGNEVIHGRKEINNYWAKIHNPVKWELSVIAVYENEEDIYENEYWKALENKPSGWRKEGVNIDNNNKSLVYQIGNSQLTTMQNGKETTSVVDFLIIWEYTDDGYKILVDTYTFQ